MKLQFTLPSNSRFQKKIQPPLKEPVLISNVFHETIKDTGSPPIFSQLNIKNKQTQPNLNTYYEPVTTVTDLNNLKYKNQPLIHPLKTSMIGRITANISSCKSCGR